MRSGLRGTQRRPGGDRAMRSRLRGTQAPPTDPA